MMPPALSMPIASCLIASYKRHHDTDGGQTAAFQTETLASRTRGEITGQPVNRPSVGERRARHSRAGRYRTRTDDRRISGGRMKRTRKTDAHVATVTISIPIDAMDLESIKLARDAINGLAAKLPEGSQVRVLSSRFGRVETVTTAAPSAQFSMMTADEYAAQPKPDGLIKVEMKASDGLDLPAPLRRVPRMD